MDTDELACARDGVPTRLRCTKCDDGICPTCMVRTPVGFDCPTCAGADEASRRRGRAGLILVGGVVVALAAVVLVGLHLAGSPSPPATDPLQTAAMVGESTLPIREAMIGEEARDGQLVFVVQDFACSPKSTPGQLCQLHFTVKNVSGGPAMFLGKFQYLVDDHHKVYGADSALTAAVPDNGGRNVDQLNVNPDVVVALVLVYDLPDTMTPTEAQFKGTGGSRFGVNVRLERRG